MTKQKLEQYIYLQQEQKDLEARIKKLQKQLDKLEEDGLVADKVRGGEGGLQSFKIEGFPMPEYSKKRTLLLLNMKKLENAEVKSLEMLNDIEDYISGIDDYLIVRIIRLRVIDGCSWKEVAQKMPGNTEDSVKKMYYRYIES